jgi:hypothetical protein
MVLSSQARLVGEQGSINVFATDGSSVGLGRGLVFGRFAAPLVDSSVDAAVELSSGVCFEVLGGGPFKSLVLTKQTIGPHCDAICVKGPRGKPS